MQSRIAKMTTVMDEIRYNYKFCDKMSMQTFYETIMPTRDSDFLNFAFARRNLLERQYILNKPQYWFPQCCGRATQDFNYCNFNNNTFCQQEHTGALLQNETMVYGDEKMWQAKNEYIREKTQEHEKTSKFSSSFLIENILKKDETKVDTFLQEVSLYSKHNVGVIYDPNLSNSSASRLSATEKKVKKFPCGYNGCQVTCANLGQLRGHLRVHTGEKPYTCDHPDCGKKFARNEELTRHRRIHTGHKPHQCPECFKRFGRKDHLNKHRKTHLKVAEKKTCACAMPGCQQRYTRSDALTRHLRSAHGIQTVTSKDDKTYKHQ